jgi:Ca2+-binding RTX toxin-like protein
VTAPTAAGHATTLRDAAGTAPWSQQTLSYDSTGTLQTQTIVNDNNTSWQTFFSGANTGILWASVYFDSDNQERTSTATYADGTHALFLFDIDNAYSWTNATIGYDAAWNATQITGTNDDGSSGVTMSMVAAALDTATWVARPHDPNANGAPQDTTLTGGSLRDVLFGYDGNDTLTGAGGNDYLDGGRGNDTMIGGAGPDQFVFRYADGDDTITDFTAGSAAGHDVIQLLGLDIADFASLQSHMTQIINNTLIAIDGHDTIFLQNVSMASLTADDFLFS